MHNVITANANLSILERAIKGRNRRDRDGKKRRPVTDALIEMVAELESRAVSAEAEIAALKAPPDLISEDAIAAEAVA